MELRERVIEKLEKAMMLSEASNECKVTLGYGVVEDILALLKAQEAVEPVYGEDNYIRCGKCKHHIVGIIAQDTGNVNVMPIVMPIQKYCSECGRAVKWE